MQKAQFRKRSKAEIREWLKTPAGQKWLQGKMAEKNAGKAAKRKRAEMAFMKSRGLHYDCAKCLHGIGKHCTNNLPDGCPSFAAAEIL